MARKIPHPAPGTSAVDRELIAAGGGFVIQCPDCGRLIVQGDDYTALDYPAEPYSEGTGATWTITKLTQIEFLGNRWVAAQANPSIQMLAHKLHDHQDPRSMVVTSRMPWHRPGTEKTKDTQL